MDANTIETPEQTAELPAGTWVADNDGTYWCLFNTHIMWAQRMWKAEKTQSYTSLDSLPYPLQLAELGEERDGYVCPHTRIQECGQCVRCGVVAGDPEKWRAYDFGSIGIEFSHPSTDPTGA